MSYRHNLADIKKTGVDRKINANFEELVKISVKISWERHFDKHYTERKTETIENK